MSKLSPITASKSKSGKPTAPKSGKSKSAPAESVTTGNGANMGRISTADWREVLGPKPTVTIRHKQLSAKRRAEIMGGLPRLPEVTTATPTATSFQITAFTGNSLARFVEMANGLPEPTVKSGANAGKPSSDNAWRDLFPFAFHGQFLTVAGKSGKPMDIPTVLVKMARRVVTGPDGYKIRRAKTPTAWGK